jgi:hypothetical protein
VRAALRAPVMHALSSCGACTFCFSRYDDPPGVVGRTVCLLEPSALTLVSPAPSQSALGFTFLIAREYSAATPRRYDRLIAIGGTNAAMNTITSEISSMAAKVRCNASCSANRIPEAPPSLSWTSSTCRS